MKIIFIAGLLCTDKIWGELNHIRQNYDCVDADIGSFNSISEMSQAIAKQFSSEEIVVIGFSMGGYVAIDLALQPDIFIKKLILINTTCYPVNPATIPSREKGIQLAQQGSLKEVLQMYEGINYYQLKEEWILLEEKMAEEVGSEIYIKQQQAIINRKNHSYDIRNILCDTLIFSSREDKIIPFTDSVYMFQNIPNSILISLSKCGHSSTLEKGNVIKEHVFSFLES